MRLNPKKYNEKLEFQIINLQYNENCFPFYDDKKFILSFIQFYFVEKKPQTSRDFFHYDFLHVPKYPNDLFLNELFESIDKIVLYGKQYLVLLLNHIENIIEKNLLTIPIIVKMVLYKLTIDDKYSLLLSQKTEQQNGFIQFLIDKALSKQIDLSRLKNYLILEEKTINQSTLFTIKHFLT
jgi:hypothetical protein